MLGQKVGPYLILEQIGQGGMGIVYRARDARLERDVALKVLHPNALADDSARRHFRKEALALARLNHTNIAAVYEFDHDGETDFIVMEFVEGKTLAVADSGGEPLCWRETLLGSVRIVTPRTRPRLEFRARIGAGRPSCPILQLAGIGC